MGTLATKNKLAFNFAKAKLFKENFLVVQYVPYMHACKFARAKNIRVNIAFED